MVGVAFLMTGLAAIAASSARASRASVAGDAGLRSPVALQARRPGPTEEQKARHTANARAVHTTPPEVNLAKVLDGLKDNEHFKGSEELAAMQAKVEQAWEADKLAKRQARTPEVAVQSAFSALQSRKATLSKSQAKITEMEAAAKAAVEAVEEAKQKEDELQVEIGKLQTDYEEELSRLVKTSDPVTHLQKSVHEALQALSGNLEAQPLISQLEAAFFHRPFERAGG